MGLIWLHADNNESTGFNVAILREVTNVENINSLSVFKAPQGFFFFFFEVADSRFFNLVIICLPRKKTKQNIFFTCLKDQCVIFVFIYCVYIRN